MLASRRAAFFIDTRPVRGELDADVLADRVLDEFEEVAPHHRLAAADVDVEDLHRRDLVDQRLGLLTVVNSSGSRRPDDERQCVHARLQA
jgi:hypothetical protein